MTICVACKHTGFIRLREMIFDPRMNKKNVLGEVVVQWVRVWVAQRRRIRKQSRYVFISQPAVV